MSLHPGNSLEALVAEVVELERKVSPGKVRVYEWRPSGLPELPAIWNWIDDGEYGIVDTASSRDAIVIRATIGVKPSDISESKGRLVRLTDLFRATFDPALDSKPLLNGAAMYGRRTLTRSSWDEFNGTPVMCMDMLMRFDLRGLVK